MPGKVYVVGVGPGSYEYVTIRAMNVLRSSDIVAGFKHTLLTVSDLVAGKQTVELTLKTQEEKLVSLKQSSLDGKVCSFTCTGDPMFSDSEFVDRIVRNFENVEIIPGVSSVQVAAARARVPLDKIQILTFHVSGDIETRKTLLLESVRNRKVVLLLPRPWDFMPDAIAHFLISNGVSEKVRVLVLENLTMENEKTWEGIVLKDILASRFSDLSIMVIGETEHLHPD